MSTRLRKNPTPAIFLALMSWFVVGFFIFLVDPEVIRNFPISGSYIPFFIFLFLAIFSTSSLLLSHSRRGLLLSIGVITFLYLRLLGLGHVLNAVLLFSLLTILEFTFSSR